MFSSSIYCRNRYTGGKQFEIPREDAMQGGGAREPQLGSVKTRIAEMDGLDVDVKIEWCWDSPAHKLQFRRGERRQMSHSSTAPPFGSPRSDCQL